MAICNGCGGVIGRDCFNAQECEYISEDMARHSSYDEGHQAASASAEAKYLPVIEKLVGALEKHNLLWNMLIAHFFTEGATSLDGFEFQENAEKCGLLKEESYDPEIHGENDVDAEAGDPWFVPTRCAHEALAEATPLLKGEK